MKENNADNPELLYGFNPPGAVYVTNDPSNPVSNTLIFNITNPQMNGPMTFQNPSQLTPADPLPARMDDDFTFVLSRFYLWFPWGTEKADLCPSDQAVNITVSPQEDNSSKWNCVRLSDSEAGTYWLLFPADKESSLAPGESISFVLDKIITGAKPGMTYMSVKNAGISGYDTETRQVEAFKENAKPTINFFNASETDITQGRQVTLSWDTYGGDYCTLSPMQEEKRFKAVDSYDICIQSSMTYTLICHGQPQASQDIQIYVEPVNIISFFADKPNPVIAGQSVILSWEAQYASACSIDQGIGNVPEKGSVTVTPKATTTYILTAEGFDGPKTISCTVEVYPVQIVGFSTDKDFIFMHGQATLSWEVQYSSACSIDNGIGNVPEKGKIVVDLSQTHIYTLTAQGFKGPVTKSVRILVGKL